MGKEEESYGLLMAEQHKNTLNYLNDKYSLVKCNDHKQSIQKHSKEDYKIPTISSVWANHLDGGMTAILAGSRSDNIEILDFDLKNAENPRKFMEEYLQLIEEQLGDKFIEKMTIQQTPSGGYHWIYRTSATFGSKILGNKKISKGKNKEAIVETRGEGGYFIIAPSKGYQIIKGDHMIDPNIITQEEREILYGSAKLLEEYKPTPQELTVSRISPSALANKFMATGNEINRWQEFDQDCDFPTMLEEDGWKIEKARGSKYLLRRPLKNDRGWSADLDLTVAEMPLLYVYTTSTALESEKAYTPSAYLIHYRCNGDTIKAYDWLISNGYAPVRKSEAADIHKTKDRIKDTPPDEVFEKYSKYKIDASTQVVRPVPIVTIEGVGVLYTGELLTLSGESKSGKSALLSATMAKVINPQAQGFEMIKSEKTELPILHFDTEQPIHRHRDNLVHNIMKRARLEEYPEQLLSYNLRRVSVDERKIMVSELIESAAKKHGGIFMLVLDGIADFINDTNDIKQSAAIVDWMLQISSTYNCGVVNVIHINPMPNGGFLKQRGHLGSELQRKTDSLLVVKKDPESGNEQSVLTAHYLRNGGIFDFGEHYIYFDRETMMHQVVKQGEPTSGKDAEGSKNELTARWVGGMTKNDAIRYLYDHAKATSLAVAKKTINDLIEYGYLLEENGKLLIKGNLKILRNKPKEEEDDVPF